MAKEPYPLAPKANTEVTIIVVIDSSLIIKNDYTLQDITIPRLSERFLNRGYKMDTLTDITSLPLSLFIAQNSV